jgi:uncharacterized membrane protein YhaH (DUF805 family)
MFTFINFIIIIILNILALGKNNPLSIIVALYGLAVLLPGISVGVRRLHDTNHSGWWYFIQLIPLIGSIWILVLLCKDSTPGDNRFGPNPKA